MVFDWVEGQTLLPEQCSSEHARRIGEVLFRMHNLDIVIDDLESPTVLIIPEETGGIIVMSQRRIQNLCATSKLTNGV